MFFFQCIVAGVNYRLLTRFLARADVEATGDAEEIIGGLADCNIDASARVFEGALEAAPSPQAAGAAQTPKAASELHGNNLLLCKLAFCVVLCRVSLCGVVFCRIELCYVLLLHRRVLKQCIDYGSVDWQC